MKTTCSKQPVTLIKQANIYPDRGLVTRSERNQRHGHHSGVIWLTGLSGAGKSTIASGVEQDLFAMGSLVSILDGDSLRAGLNADLDFTVKSREENLRRAGEVATLFADTGHIVIASFVSPHQHGRQFVKNIVRENFYLVHIKADVEDCIDRDPKGLYKKAMDGRISNFTGVGQSYEDPHDADLVINTSENSIDDCRKLLLDFIQSRFCV